MIGSYLAAAFLYLYLSRTLAGIVVHFEMRRGLDLGEGAGIEKRLKKDVAMVWHALKGAHGERDFHIGKRGVFKWL